MERLRGTLRSRDESRGETAGERRSMEGCGVVPPPAAGPPGPAPKERMSEMINPEAKDVGRRVVYVPGDERGVITSYNTSYVFVRYDGDFIAKATRRENLHFVEDTALAKAEGRE